MSFNDEELHRTRIYYGPRCKAINDRRTKLCEMQKPSL